VGSQIVDRGQNLNEISFEKKVVTPLTKNSVHKRLLERVLFEEKPSADTGLFVALAVILLIDDLAIALLLLYFNIPREVLYVVAVINILLLGFLYSFVTFRRVKLTDQRVYIRFGISRSSILVSDMRFFSVSDPPAWSRMVPGVPGWRGKRVYCFKTGSPFVMIEHGTGKPRRVFFNVDHLPEFVAMLRALKENE
jgi:hypothetical protein